MNHKTTESDNAKSLSLNRLHQYLAHQRQGCTKQP